MNSGSQSAQGPSASGIRRGMLPAPQPGLKIKTPSREPRGQNGGRKRKICPGRRRSIKRTKPGGGQTKRTSGAGIYRPSFPAGQRHHPGRHPCTASQYLSPHFRPEFLTYGEVLTPVRSRGLSTSAIGFTFRHEMLPGVHQQRINAPDFPHFADQRTNLDKIRTGTDNVQYLHEFSIREEKSSSR